MPKYDVTITAKVIKTYRIKADSKGAAEEIAHQDFDIRHEEGIEEDYDQETDRIVEVPDVS